MPDLRRRVLARRGAGALATVLLLATMGPAAACPEKRFARVYRVPGYGEFDRALTQVAARQHIGLVLVDTRYSRSALNVVEQKILARESLLEKHGVRLMSFSMPPEGYLLVGVQGSIPVARRILADFADQISVHRGHASIPA